MKQKIIGLSQRYVTALRKSLKQGPRASLQPALRLGRQAVALGLETLELARIHERALATLELSHSKNGVIKRAEIFDRDHHPDLELDTAPVAPTSKSAVSRISKSANLERLNGRWSFGALPIWKSAIQQVWKPALRGRCQAARENCFRPDGYFVYPRSPRMLLNEN
jgi:hypothetical protein